MSDLNRVLLRDLRGRPKKYLTFEEVQAPPKAASSLGGAAADKIRTIKACVPSSVSSAASRR